MDIPFTGRLKNESRRAFDPDYLTIGFLLLSLAAGPVYAADNDYPTSARADYVIGCMAANGNTHEALLKCSCAIDTIASLMPYSHYEQAETALSLQAGGGVVADSLPEAEYEETVSKAKALMSAADEAVRFASAARKGQ